MKSPLYQRIFGNRPMRRDPVEAAHMIKLVLLDETEGIDLSHHKQKCDICGKPRPHGNHKRCSKIRQKRYAKEDKS